MQMKALLHRMHVLGHAEGTLKVLQYCAHALLELGDCRLACGPINGSWRGGLHGSANIFCIFLRILLTALQLFLRPVSSIGSICASPSRPF
jgi:hypothetical protein